MLGMFGRRCMQFSAAPCFSLSRFQTVPPFRFISFYLTSCHISARLSQCYPPSSCPPLSLSLQPCTSPFLSSSSLRRCYSAKARTSYKCSSCGATAPKWEGKCSTCGEWGTLEQVVATSVSSRVGGGGRGASLSSLFSVVQLDEVTAATDSRTSTGIDELDLVLGGGLVQGSFILLGGDPGIGKSTLALQTADRLSQQGKKVVYISGEETLSQVKLRADRVGGMTHTFSVATESNVEVIVDYFSTVDTDADVLIIDSVQTLTSGSASTSMGSAHQIREISYMLMKLAKSTNTVILLIGHVTKDGAIAGPRALEHLVDTVLYFDAPMQTEAGDMRVLRSFKNRFGATNEMGVFEMTSEGLVSVPNPQSLFLSTSDVAYAGTSTTAVMEGSRGIVVQLQSLVGNKKDYSSPSYPDVRSIGIDVNRVRMLKAVMDRVVQTQLGGRDLHLNVVGGVKVNDPSADAPIVLSLLSSLLDTPIPKNVMSVGEVGLSGELLPVRNFRQRVLSAASVGIDTIFCSVKDKTNANRLKLDGVEIVGVKNISQLKMAVLGGKEIGRTTSRRKQQYE
uniref:RecA family profile 1 domain-containing protein n=1 Tax=Palpitomonas bilix TaxID=652834 RepID=A0A7S3GAK7_9EUKA